MSVLIDAVARAFAQADGRARVVRATAALAPDAERSFAIALIKVVSEEQVQAIAYGDPDAAPLITARWNPLSRESGDLEPFARALDEYVTDATTRRFLPRVWVPHPAAVTLLDVLAYRYRTNQQASPLLQRMGWLCRALVDESRMQGQQVVAIASDVLCEHVVSGMSPLKERHLGAMLAWIDPVQGVDPYEEAERRALVPAAGMLTRPDDDIVEKLRRRAKAGDADARAEIEQLLSDGVRVEWDRLIAARRAFWGLGLPTTPGIAALVSESTTRMTYALGLNRSPASRPDALSNLLESEEYAAALRDDVDVRGDVRVRDRARRQGRAITATVVQVIQPVSNRKPCTLIVRTTQEVMRIRRGTTLSNLANNISGRIADIAEEAGTGATRITLTIDRGVRRSTLPAAGAELEWVDSEPFNAQPLLIPVYQELRTARPALAYDETLPAPIPRTIDAGDLAGIAAGLRRAR